VPASIHFADLTSPRARVLLDPGPVPVLLLPVGAVEPHGPHAPLGTDSIISAAVCERAAVELAARTSEKPLKAERIATTYGYDWLDRNVGPDGRLAPFETFPLRRPRRLSPSRHPPIPTGRPSRSRPQTSTRESHLRSLMGLPSREAAP